MALRFEDGRVPGFLTVRVKVYDAMRQAIKYVYDTMKTLDYDEKNIQLGDVKMESITFDYRNEPQLDVFGTISKLIYLSSTQGTGSDHKDIRDNKREQGVGDHTPLGATGI